MNRLPVWRKVLIVISCIFIVVIAVFTGILSEEVHRSCDWSDYTLISYDRQKALMTRFLFKVGIGLALVVFYTSSWELGNSNRTAKKLCRFIRVYFILLVVVAFFATRLYPDVDLVQRSDIMFYYCYFGFVITVFLYSILNSYLSKHSNIEKSPYFLFPNWVINLYGLKSHLAKRVFGLFILYPFYYLAPIPVAGLFVLLYYVLPLSLIVLLLSGLVRIVKWILEGWTMDRNEIKGTGT